MSNYWIVESEITDPKSKATYKIEIERVLGRGSFGICLEFINTKTNETFAGKIISKKYLTKMYNEIEISEEISIHTAMSHRYIVSLHSHFEDDNNIYIILELCRNRSLMQMHQLRATLTIAEVRYFMRQIVLACKYMHKNKVIHRDLKPANLFLNDKMEIKVGDFGLATRLSFDGERLTSSCGTPNYIAPEILKKTGYSYEVDIWSLGCIMYTLLVGYPPFRGDYAKMTHNNILNNQYYLPKELDTCASKLIKKLLHPEPKSRPCASEILKDGFFQNCYIPSRIPASCLSRQSSQEELILFELQSMGNNKLIASGTHEVMKLDGEKAKPVAFRQSSNEGNPAKPKKRKVTYLDMVQEWIEAVELQSMGNNKLIASGTHKVMKLDGEKAKPVAFRQSSNEGNPAKPKKRKVTYLDMVQEAIEAVGVPQKGASVQAIKKYIYGKKEKKYRDYFIKKALITGVERGILQKTNKVDRGGATGSFALVRLQKTKKSFQNTREKFR